MGIETMVTFWPFQSTGSRYWDEFTTNGYLVNKINKTNAEPTSYDGGNQYLVDETNPKVREVVFDKFWEGYGQYGIKTVWIDAAEPEHNGAQDEGAWSLESVPSPSSSRFSLHPASLPAGDPQSRCFSQSALWCGIGSSLLEAGRCIRPISVTLLVHSS
jgi:alpha-glucosidase (family GH31 glycosyl hydrolase)